MKENDFLYFIRWQYSKCTHLCSAIAVKYHPIAALVSVLWLALFSPRDLAGVSSVSANDSVEATEERSIEAVVSHLEGVMSTASQAASDPNFVGVQMTTCRVEIENSQPSSVYLYQEQALIEDLSSPYRQRFLQITDGEQGRIDSHTFKPNDLSQWIGFCEQPTRSVALTNLGEQTCSVSLRPSAVGGFVGSTPPNGCVANVRGARSVTNVVVLHSQGMDTWDRGLDAAGNQVWGAENTPYRYRR